MNTKYTPGPWHLADNRYVTAEESGGIIARCDGTNQANIPLILAAPEMLGALIVANKTIGFAMENCIHSNAAHAQMQIDRDIVCSAILKATGGKE